MARDSPACRPLATPKDGLKLTNACISAVVRCAPPENKPTLREIANCQPYLEAEIDTLTRIRVVVTLGRIAFDTYWRLMAKRGVRPRPQSAFAHGRVFTAPDIPGLVASYHPSQRNTNTGKLTPQMMAEVFQKVRGLLED